MKRTIHILPPFAIALLLGLAACAGKTVAVGTNEEQLRAVDPKSIAATTTVPACATSTQAHPNVCCTGGPKEVAACHAYVTKPFHKCDAGLQTYPDPEQCCDLNNPESCVRPPSTTPPSGGNGGTCGYVCQPGWYPEGGGCCRTYTGANGEVSGECYAEAKATKVTSADPPYPIPDPAAPSCKTASDCGPNSGASCARVCHDGSNPCGNTCRNDRCVPRGCPEDDAGVVDASPPETDAGADCTYDHPCPIPLPEPGPTPVPTPPPGVPSSCSLACPDGFTAAINDPAICCRDTPEGDICFSQAQGWVGNSSSGSTAGKSGSSGGGAVDKPPVPTCRPLPCPSGAPFDPIACACVASATDAGAGR